VIYSIYRPRLIEYFNDTTTIPTNIWQTYKSKILPIQASTMRQTWVDKNPGWNMELYDDNDIDAYIQKSWDKDMYGFFQSLPLGVMKADLWRYLILTTHGGVYTDIDSICITSIKDWFHTFSGEHALVISPEKGGEIHFCQWTIYCTKEHPAMRFICKYILQNYLDNGIDTSSEHFVHTTTGPSIWTNAIKAYLNIVDLNAQQIYDMYSKDKTQFVQKGIYILSADHFQGIYSKNEFGSLFFGDGYVKWTEERDRLVEEFNK